MRLVVNVSDPWVTLLSAHNYVVCLILSNRATIQKMKQNILTYLVPFYGAKDTYAYIDAQKYINRDYGETTEIKS